MTGLRKGHCATCNCPEPVSKQCGECRAIKSLEAFGVDRSRRDGLTSRCRECERMRSRAYYAANREKVLARHASAYAKGQRRPTQSAHRKAHREANPIATRAAKRADRERYKALTANPTRSGRWTMAEDLMATRFDLTVLEIASILGRTHKSVRGRRRLLRKKGLM